jgi:NADPH-dependent F420 reductase
MKVGILGGTGKLGLALAVRLHQTGHTVMIGSRDAAKAADASQKLDPNVKAGTNLETGQWCDLAFISVPYSAHKDLLDSMNAVLEGKIIIDATVPIDPANLRQIRTNSGKSAAEETAAAIPHANVYAAFHTISHRVLRQPDATHDVLVAGAASQKSEVMDLVRSMRLRPVDAGPMEVAGHLERVTVLLLSINMANKVKESGIKITGI